MIVAAVLIIWEMTNIYNKNTHADNESLLSLLNTSPIPDITVNANLADDPSNHTWNTIQEAIDDANETSVIYVHSGTYRENLAINKPLTLIGADNNSTIIDGGYEGDAVHIKANNVRVSGFKIINGRSRLDRATMIWGAAAIGSSTWTPENFGGFFYDIENAAGNETLEASVRGKDIESGGLTYTTTSQEVNFGYSPFGSYEVIGFMGERFFAGYTSNSSISGNKVINALENEQVHKILLDDRDTHTIPDDGTLSLKEGYTLRLEAVDAGKVRVSLLKDGNEVDSGAVKRNETYIYSKWSGKITDLPVIAVHIDSFFRGKETNTTVIKGIFQISGTFNGLAATDRYGNMDISQVSLNGITMKNYYPVQLLRNSTISVTENMGFKIADSDTLRFYPYIIKTYGISSDVKGRAVRGQGSQTWDADSFSGFYYNPDTDIKPEKLYISAISGRTVEKGNLVYETRVSPEYFGIYTHKRILINGKTNYSIIGLGGKAYAAIGGKSNKVAEILIDDGEASTGMVSDETWDLGEGYSLTAQSVYSSLYGPRPPDREIWIKNKNGNYIGQARLSLRKNGVILKNETIPEGGAFIYSANLSNETNIPVFVTYLDEVWGGTTMDHAVLKYTWLMSQDVKEIKSGDIFNRLEVANITPEEIVFKNNRPVSFDQGSVIPLVGNIQIRVADSSELRYYPAVSGVSGGEESAGIAIEGSENIIISDNNILDNYYGIHLISTKDSLLEGNTVSNSGYGIYMSSSGSNILINNRMADNLYNLGVFGYGSDFDNSIDTSNTVDGKRVYYIKGSSNAVYDASIGAGTFYCINCVNITVKDMELDNNGAGVFFWNTTRSKIQNINASYNYYGIYLMSSGNNMLSSNIVLNGISPFYLKNNQYLYFMQPQRPGIHLASSNNNVVTGNAIYYGGISLHGSSINRLESNRYFYTDLGVTQDDLSKNNVITDD